MKKRLLCLLFALCLIFSALPLGALAAEEDEATLPTLPEDVTLPTLPEDVTLPTLPEDVTLPTLPEDVTLPTLPEDAALPTLPEDATLPTLPEDVTLPTLPEDVTLPTLPEDVTLPTLPEDVTLPTLPEDVTLPTFPSEPEETEPTEEPEPTTDSHLVHSPELVNAVEPTYLEPGYSGDLMCSECGEILVPGTEIAPTGENSVLLDNPFTDVKPLAYYYDSVLWAYYGGITTGTTKTTFSPHDDCTRAQVVTFLWRAAGQPEPRIVDSPFTDIAANAYYYKAVLWAVEEGITTGTTKTTFSPERTCSRGEVVTFLWRNQGKPQPLASENAFPDVKAGHYYSDAVAWAVENGITEGYLDGTFRPDVNCTRAQIVTFLYRSFAA